MLSPAPTRYNREDDMPRAGRDTQEWRRLRKQCFARDKAAHAPCHICGQPIDYALKPSSTPDAWEPDHRFTVKSHPELAELPENILPSHRRCNRARGDKASIDNLGNQSRNWNW